MTDGPAGKGGSVIVLRPGALGDVLVTRAALRYLKTAVPDADVVLVAPGEQGRFLNRPGWADTVVDWDAAWLSWLFSDGADAPPDRLAELFQSARLVVAFTRTGSVASVDDGLARRIGRLTAAPVYLAPSRPNADELVVAGDGDGDSDSVSDRDGNGNGRIDSWLVGHVRTALKSMSGCILLAEADERVVLERYLNTRIPVAVPSPELVPYAAGQRFLAIHAGSGGRMKNWPVERFAAVAEALRRDVVDGVVLTAGEADGEIGTRLAALIPGAVLVENRSLTDVARVLAHAAVYIGNDSGVSHLAAAVRPECGGDGPAMTVLFGPSDPSVWCPRGAVPVRCGTAMADISVDAVVAAVRSNLRSAGAVPGKKPEQFILTKTPGTTQ